MCVCVWWWGQWAAFSRGVTFSLYTMSLSFLALARRSLTTVCALTNCSCSGLGAFLHRRTASATRLVAYVSRETCGPCVCAGAGDGGWGVGRGAGDGEWVWWLGLGLGLGLGVQAGGKGWGYSVLGVEC